MYVAGHVCRRGMKARNISKNNEKATTSPPPQRKTSSTLSKQQVNDFCTQNIIFIFVFFLQF